MDAFSARYLVCTTEGTPSDTISLVAGPAFEPEPISSDAIDEMVEYRLEEMKAVVRSLAGVREVSPNLLVWQQSDRSIGMQFDEPGLGNTGDDGDWIGSYLSVRGTVLDFVRFWLQLLERLPGLYVHSDSCRMYTPTSYLEEEAVPALFPAFLEDDATLQRAVSEFRNYTALCPGPRHFADTWSQAAAHMVPCLFDLIPPVAPLTCQTELDHDKFASAVRNFDSAAKRHGLSYFAYSPSWSTFKVWVPFDQEPSALAIARELDIFEEDY